MEQPIDSESVAWVDRQVAAAIRPQVQHEPDTALGLIRLRRLSGQRRLQSRRRSWAAVIFVALVTLVVALPPARVYAVQCVDACIAGGRFVLEKLRPNEQKLSISHKERRQAPDFELPDSKGTPVQLSAYRGQVVVLNFWATWCNPCRLVIPWFVEFQRAYDAKGFSVIGVSARNAAHSSRENARYGDRLGSVRCSIIVNRADARPSHHDRTGASGRREPPRLRTG